MFYTGDGSFWRDFHFDIFPAESKVNNLPARFTNDSIIFSFVENGKYEVKVDRYTGIAIYGKADSPNLFRGQCVKVEGRQF